VIRIKVAHGLSEESKERGRYRIGEGITGLVVQSGKEIVVPDISKDPRFLHKIRSRKEAQRQRIAFFCVPIKLEGKTIGALSVDKRAGTKDDFEANVRLLNVISTMVAQAVKLNRLVESDRRQLHDENVRLRRELKTRFNIHNMVGTSNAMREVYRLIEQVANSNATVLIRGESGTGKDLSHTQSITTAIVPTGPLSKSTVPLCRIHCSKASSSAMKKRSFHRCHRKEDRPVRKSPWRNHLS